MYTTFVGPVDRRRVPSLSLHTNQTKHTAQNERVPTRHLLFIRLYLLPSNLSFSFLACSCFSSHPEYSWIVSPKSSLP